MNLFFLFAISGVILFAGGWFTWKQYFCKCKHHQLSAGDKAPEFTLADETGTYRKLTEFLGKNVVLYFYPKDDTPGCTAQACSFRDAFKDYESKNIAVIGVSYDSPESHQAFKKKHALPFILLSDTGKQVARAYGVNGALFIQRTTFLINEKGILLDVMHNVDVKNDAEKIIEFFKKH